MSKTPAEPREKVKIFAVISVLLDEEKVEYKAVGRMRVTAVMIINDEKVSAMALLNLAVKLPKEAVKIQQPRIWALESASHMSITYTASRVRMSGTPPLRWVVYTLRLVR